MDIGSLTLLIKDNAGLAIATLFIVLSGSAGIVKMVLSRKSKDVSIKVGNISGNKTSIAGRDVRKN